MSFLRYLWCLGRCTVKAEMNKLCKIIVLKMKRPRFFWNADVWNFSLLFSFLYIDGRNNIVSSVKQYCFTSQTLVFGSSNNIVSRMKKMCLGLMNVKEIGVVEVSC